MGVDTRDLIRQINRQASGVISYPFDRVRRVEFSGTTRRLTFEREIRQRKFCTGLGPGCTADLLQDVNQTVPFGRALNLMSGSAAYVYDNSIFGATSPIMGQRYRLEVTPTVGSLNFMGVGFDARKYIMVKSPFTLAGRVLHFGRYGRDADDGVLSPLYMGYAGFVRGYDFNSFDPRNECPQQGPCEVVDQLFGSKMVVANLELRFPLFGALGLGPGMYGVFPVEFAVFGDAGLAWDSRTDRTKAAFLGGQRKPVYSTGIGFRINLFGFMLVEIDYVKPFQRPGKGTHWQFSFQPGF